MRHKWSYWMKVTQKRETNKTEKNPRYNKKACDEQSWRMNELCGTIILMVQWIVSHVSEWKRKRKKIFRKCAAERKGKQLKELTSDHRLS